MSTEVQPWEEQDRAPAQRAPVAHLVTADGPPPAANDIDSWVEIASAYTRLANQIANTDFPPAEMRGKPEALVATFLMGREMHLGPMTALMNMHVIKGKVGQSAHLMRAQILAAGHEFDIIEASDTRVVARGRRRNEHSYTDVAFTADQARRAKIDLGGYPEDKLVARATARLARRKFADVISGMAYSTEELGDGDYAFEDDAVQASTAAAAPGDEEAPAPARTARRPASRRASSASTRRAASPAKSVGAAAPSGPPLPGEDEPAEQHGQPAGVSTDGSDDDSRDEPATTPQGKRLGAIFNEAGITDRAERLAVTGRFLRRDVESWKSLTKREAGALIDTFEKLQRDGGMVAAIVSAAEKVRAEQQGGGEQGQLGEVQDEPVDAEVVDDDQPTAGDDTAEDSQ